MKSQMKDLPLTDNSQYSARKADWGGMKVRMYEMHQSITGELCQRPHWGYIFEGEFRCQFTDHEETYTAGDVFYLPPGHTMTADPGLVFVMFTPEEEE